MAAPVTHTEGSTVYYARLMKFESGAAPEIHEVSHLVAACQLGVPARGIQSDADGYYLDRPQWGRQPTADDLVRMAVVAHAGPVAEWLLADRTGRTASDLASDGDRSVLRQCESWFAEFYPELIWPDDLHTFAGHLFVSPPVQQAVHALARGLRVVGHLPLSVANDVLTELNVAPAVAPVIREKAKPVAPAAPEPAVTAVPEAAVVPDPEHFVGLGI
jgi:hypothetical protein